MPVLDLYDRPCIILQTDPGMMLIGRGGTVDGACLPIRRAQGVCPPGCDDLFDRQPDHAASGHAASCPAAGN